jgi:hypothetical protein
MSFKRFDIDDITVSAESITAPVWSTGAPTLSTFYTASAQYSANNQYYVDVYQTGSNLTNAAVQFSISYANKQGSGSVLFNSAVNGKSPTSVLYGQYRTLVLGNEEADFSLDGLTLDQFYVLSIDRARYREKLLPGTFEITTDNGKFIDNSSTLAAAVFGDAGRVYKLVSGSISGGVVNSAERGYFLPDIGTILLETGSIASATGTSSNTNDQNSRKFFDALTNIRLNSEETISSQYAFVRVRNSEFNYSTNPSNITGSGDLRHDVMVNSPQAYMTTVGLYNDNNDLLAVAKLSQPLLKDFTKEALVRIKLDF